ncbi:hypothetical protein K466DRAFT_455503, partial [Polyporus arcularius HHB13444]
VINTVHTGKRGRPSKAIDPTFLRHALDIRGPAHIAKVLKCSARHVRREALRHGLVEAGAPVFQTLHNADGSTSRLHTTQTAPVSTLSDAELDAVIADLLLSYPTMGHVMLVGDGFSRFVTGIRVHTNNRADTVLGLFLEAI